MHRHTLIFTLSLIAAVSGICAMMNSQTQFQLGIGAGIFGLGFLSMMAAAVMKSRLLPRRKLKQVALVDVSGSTDRLTLDAISRKLIQLSTCSDIDVIEFSNDIVDHYRFDGRLHASNGGCFEGTNLGKAWKGIRKNRCQCLLVFTDGYFTDGDFIGEPNPGIMTVWFQIGPHPQKGPDWAINAQLDEDKA